MRGTFIPFVGLACISGVLGRWSDIKAEGVLDAYPNVFQQPPPPPPAYMVDNTDNLSGQAPNKGEFSLFFFSLSPLFFFFFFSSFLLFFAVLGVFFAPGFIACVLCVICWVRKSRLPDDHHNPTCCICDFHVQPRLFRVCWDSSHFLFSLRPPRLDQEERFLL